MSILKQGSPLRTYAGSLWRITSDRELLFGRSDGESQSTTARIDTDNLTMMSDMNMGKGGET